MKKILSMLLVVVMLFSLATLTVAADGTQSETTIPDVGVTQATYKNSDYVNAISVSELTANGLFLDPSQGTSAGFVLATTDYDLTEVSNYKISFDATINFTKTNDGQNEFNFQFGFGLNPEVSVSKVTTPYVSGDRTYESTYRRWTYTNAQGVADNRQSVADAAYAGNTLTMEFVVEGNKLTKVNAICNGITQNWIVKEGYELDATVGAFGFSMYSSTSTNRTMTIKNLKVTVGEEATPSYSVDFAARYEARCVAEAKFVQMSTDKTAMRVLAEVALPEANFADFECVGFEVAKTGGTNTLTGTTTTLYKSVSTNGEPYVAGDGIYLAAMVIQNIPTTGTYTFTVKPFIKDTAGNVYYGTEVSFAITEGVVVPDGNINE
ncbi:MAG: hypothetical protein IJW55_06860 [Clostridia bacterium]|nr:hypothetical protein [Clostridia bacterium]